MDVRVRKLLAAQDGIAAWRQLRAVGITNDVAARLVRDWTEMHDGVWLAGHGTPTNAQRYRAATLTAPRTALSLASAAEFYGMRRSPGGVVTVTRPGRRGTHQIGLLLIHYSTTLAGNVIKPNGFWVTTVERTIIDLWPHLDDRQRRKLLREALRLRKTTCHAMRHAIKAHRGRRGIAALNALVSRYERLQLERCRSDAEAFAMEVLDAAGLELPAVNAEIAGEEADLSWPGFILELDGPGYHVLTDEDARKTRAWKQAGNRVRRMSTDTLFADPQRLVRLAVTNLPPRT